MQRDERRRARRVHRHRRAFESEGVREPARHGTGTVAGPHVALGVLSRHEQQRRVVLAVRTGEHSGTASTQGGRVDSCPLERLPRRLEQQSLLRVHRGGLAGGDPEEAGVEVPDVMEESALRHVRGTRVVRVRVVQRVQVPAAVDREPGHPVGACGKQLPQFFR